MISKPAVPLGVLILAALAAFSFGAIVKVAGADHYHTNCNGHGLVHGSSKYDSAYHSRVEGTPCQRYSACHVGQFGNVIKTGYAGPGSTCNTFLSGYGPECEYGNAWVELSGVFGYHRHDGHQPC